MQKYYKSFALHKKAHFEVMELNYAKKFIDLAYIKIYCFKD